MERTLTGELRPRVGERVRLAGWLHHQRRLARLTFVLLRDRAGLAQVVVEEPEAIEAVAALLPETVLEVEAAVVGSDQAPGGVELRDPTFTVLAEPAEAPPVELRRPELKESLPVQLDYAPVALRHPRRREAFEIAAASVRGFRAALDALGFVEIQTPKLVASATEGGSNVFRVDYFGRDAYLAQSPQFFKQTMVGVFERVYEVGPVFRAEPHETSRHLAEYVSLDAELGFVRDHFDVMRVLREAVAGMCESVRAAGFEAPEVPAEIPWVHFADTAVEDVDLAPADERRLCEEHGSEFLFVTGYPMAKRPFYTHPEPGRPEFSNSFDLLFRGLEIVTGGERLHRYEDYVAALDGETAPFEGYLQAFKYGMPPHGGFALGLERWVARLTGAQNIRETTLFPRDRGRLTP
ncbi:MAG TPA: aspartate--tRNA(Asn) ligase [Gaiellaceae bacterium]|jgi:nondiscriminating aspartyl-tRNA synthetase|nr:aspartate--tRNA(Asn) ligase [Gaiellaceae bacterium]